MKKDFAGADDMTTEMLKLRFLLVEIKHIRSIIFATTNVANSAHEAMFWWNVSRNKILEINCFQEKSCAHCTDCTWLQKLTVFDRICVYKHILKFPIFIDYFYESFWWGQCFNNARVNNAEFWSKPWMHLWLLLRIKSDSGSKALNERFPATFAYALLTFA